MAINVTIQLRQDTAANWTSKNPVLKSIEPGVETDTGKSKIGDGLTAWADLSYWNPSGEDGAVASVFGRSGVVIAETGDYSVAQITGAAPVASPAFTGTVTVGGVELGSAAFQASSAFDAAGDASTAQSNAETYANTNMVNVTGDSMTGPLVISAGESAGAVLKITNTTSTPTSPSVQFVAAAAADQMLGINVTGDTFQRLNVDSDGVLHWGSGSAATDTTISRTSTATLTLTGALAMAATTNGGVLHVTNSQAAPTTPSTYLTAHSAADSTFGIAVSGDADPRFYIDSNGKMFWGTGSAATDTVLDRGGANTLQTGNIYMFASKPAGQILQVQNFTSAPTAPTSVITAAAAADSSFGIEVASDADYRFTIDSNGKMFWGSGSASFDVSFQRSGVGALQSNGKLDVITSSSNGNVFDVVNNTSAPTAPNFQVISAAAGDSAVGLDVSGDADFRFTVDSNGKMYWGSGSATGDTDLYRSAAGTLKTDNALTVTGTLAGGLGAFSASSTQVGISYSSSAGQILKVVNATSAPSAPSVQIYAAAAADTSFGIGVTGDAHDRFTVDSNGEHYWGTGAAAVDTWLYRSATSTLNTNGALVAGGYVQGTRLVATGLTGATAASRYVGATASGAPASGTFNVGDFVIDQTGSGLGVHDGRHHRHGLRVHEDWCGHADGLSGARCRQPDIRQLDRRQRRARQRLPAGPDRVHRHDRGPDQPGSRAGHHVLAHTGHGRRVHGGLGQRSWRVQLRCRWRPDP